MWIATFASWMGVQPEGLAGVWRPALRYLRRTYNDEETDLNSPSTSDLLLTLHIRELAVKRRNHEASETSGLSISDPRFQGFIAAWEKDIDYFIADVTDELKGLWPAISTRLKPD